jgi:hypothetical protein
MIFTKEVILNSFEEIGQIAKDRGIILQKPGSREGRFGML